MVRLWGCCEVVGCGGCGICYVVYVVGVCLVIVMAAVVAFLCGEVVWFMWFGGVNVVVM